MRLAFLVNGRKSKGCRGSDYRSRVGTGTRANSGSSRLATLRDILGTLQTIRGSDGRGVCLPRATGETSQATISQADFLHELRSLTGPTARSAHWPRTVVLPEIVALSTA